MTTAPVQHTGAAGETVRLLKPREAAALLAICPRKLWELTNAGVVPCLRIGRSVRYDVRDLVAWIERQKQEASG